jgi:hypothetical protein
LARSIVPPSDDRGAAGLPPDPRWSAGAVLYRSSPRRDTTLLRWIVTLAAVAFGTILVTARQTGVGALDTLWAEDGAVFLADALRGDLASTVFAPAVGYVHVVPRAMAALASALPMEAAPYVMSGGAALVLAGLAVFVFHASDAYLEHTWTRLLVAVSVILVPAGGAEVFNSAALLHFFLMYAAFWALIWVPERPTGLVVACLVVLAAALSDPLTLVLAPLVVGRVIFVRGWPQHIVTVCFAVGLTIQALVITTSETARELPASAGVAELMGWFLLYVPTTTVFGERLTGGSEGVGLLILVVGALAIWVGVLLIGWRSRHDPRFLLALTAAGTSAVLYLVPAFAAGTHAPRYATGPVLLLVVSLGSLVDVVWPSPLKSAPGTVTALVLGALALAWTTSLPLINERTDGQPWGDSLEEARASCASPGSADHVQMPINPPGWTMEVPCSELG